jgi:hypothetical protein
MAWNSPVTWVNDTTPSAADFNAQLRDNLEYLKGQAGPISLEDLLELPESATPTTPASGLARFYPKTDGHFYGLNDGGVERLMTGIRGMGTAFPTSPAPATNDLFFRTDLGLLCYYDGTRWLTADEYIIVLPWFPLITLPYTGTVPNTILLLPTRSDYGYYITKASCYTRVATTNNGSNYWGLRLLYSATNLWDFNTSAQAADVNVTHTNAAINTATTPTATFLAINAQTKTGAPGSLTVAAFVQYRLIIT